MKKSMVALLSVVSMASLLAGGCANKEAVKKEEPIVPTAAVEKVEPAKPVDQAIPADQVKPIEQSIPSETVKPAQDETARAQGSSQASAEAAFEPLYFDFDKSDLRQDARDVLSKNADIFLKSFAGAKIQIEGHCDERGSAEYNLALGEYRAKAAKKYLTTLGVKGENLSIISYGKEKPAVKGNDEAAWAKNRRAEFVIVK